MKRTRSSKRREPQTRASEGDPKRGDAILKRMLQTKPKPHKELVKKPVARKERKSNG